MRQWFGVASDAAGTQAVGERSKVVWHRNETRSSTCPFRMTTQWVFRMRP
jgi:hypothetical protein